MAYIIGIDTGGTYTDAVLLDSNKHGAASVERKSKAFTTHIELEQGIRSSIEMLDLTKAEIEGIEKVVLSTTLATNAIVEGKLHKVGLILIGGVPKGGIAAEYVYKISGTVNIKGRILSDIDEEEARKAVEELIPKVDAIAVSGLASVRNPALEQKVKTVIKGICDLPVMCGHEFVSDLGFLERTNTVVINAGLLPVINHFIKAIKSVLEQLNIKAPVFVVKGDGSIAKVDTIQNTPIDTVLSGPAASMIGAVNLSGINDAIVADMGGTTTDTGIVRKKRVELSPDGAIIGSWKIRIKSAKLYTFGLGGDSRIKFSNGAAEIGPERVLPSCRGGDGEATPTDILHYTGEFEKWNRAQAVSSIEKQAEKAGMTPNEYVTAVKAAIAEKIEENMSGYGYLNLPITAIGAPSGSWYRIAKEKYGFDLVIPRHYEVANAVGAATAGIQEEAEAVVRPGEDGHGYLAHTKTGRHMFPHREEAVKNAVEITKACAIRMITEQDLEPAQVILSCEDIYDHDGQLIHEELCMRNDGQIDYWKNDSFGAYMGTRIRVTVSGKIFHNMTGG